MKNISILLIFLILLQSCSIYDTPASIETAVAVDKKVKIITTNKREFKFKRLENKNDRLIGITKPRSSTAKNLRGLPAEIAGKHIEIDLSNIDIEKIRLRNDSDSIILTVAAIAASLVVAWYIYLGISLSNSDFLKDF